MSGDGTDFTLRYLEPVDLELILEMQQQISEDLLDPSVFQTSTSEFIAYCLDGGGRVYGVSHGERTVAYRIVYYPRDRNFNLARYSSLPAEQHGCVAQWDTIGVLPEWRGNGLVRLLNTQALADVARSEFRHLFATTSPANPSGIRAMFSAGFRAMRLFERFEGRLRFLGYRRAQSPWPAPDTDSAHRSIPLGATDELRDALAQGWVGHTLLDEQDELRLGMSYEPVSLE